MSRASAWLDCYALTMSKGILASSMYLVSRAEDKTVEFGGAEGRSHGSTKLDRTKNLQAKIQVRCIWGLWVEAQEKIQSAMMGQLLVGNLGLLCFRRNFPYY